MARKSKVVINFVGDSNKLRRTLRTVNKDLKKLEGDIEQIGVGGMSKLGAMIKNNARAIGIGAAAALAAGASAVVREAVRTYTEADREYRKVMGLTRDAGDETLNYLVDMGIKIRQRWALPLTELAQATYQALSGGISEENLSNFMGTVGRFSKGEFVDPLTTVDLFTTVINAFNLAEEDIASIADSFSATITFAKTTGWELGRFLFQVASNANDAGIGLQEVQAGLAVLTKMGVPTRVASTRIRQMLIELGKEGSRASNVFKEAAGQSFPDFIKAGGDMIGAVRIMSKHAAKTDTVLTNFFANIESGGAATALASEKGLQIFNDALKEIQNSFGETSIKAHRALQGISGQWDQFAASVGGTITKVGGWIANTFLAPLLPEGSTRIDLMVDLFTQALIKNTEEGLIPNTKQIQELLEAHQELVDRYNESITAVNDPSFLQTQRDFARSLALTWQESGDYDLLRSAGGNIQEIVSVLFESPLAEASQRIKEMAGDLSQEAYEALFDETYAVQEVNLLKSLGLEMGIEPEDVLDALGLTADSEEWRQMIVSRMPNLALGAMEMKDDLLDLLSEVPHSLNVAMREITEPALDLLLKDPATLGWKQHFEQIKKDAEVTGDWVTAARNAEKILSEWNYASVEHMGLMQGIADVTDEATEAMKGNSLWGKILSRDYANLIKNVNTLRNSLANLANDMRKRKAAAAKEKEREGQPLDLREAELEMKKAKDLVFGNEAENLEGIVAHNFLDKVWHDGEKYLDEYEGYTIDAVQAWYTSMKSQVEALRRVGRGDEVGGFLDAELEDLKTLEGYIGSTTYDQLVADLNKLREDPFDQSGSGGGLFDDEEIDPLDIRLKDLTQDEVNKWINESVVPLFANSVKPTIKSRFDLTEEEIAAFFATLNQDMSAYEAAVQAAIVLTFTAADLGETNADGTRTAQSTAIEHWVNSLQIELHGYPLDVFVSLNANQWKLDDWTGTLDALIVKYQEVFDANPFLAETLSKWFFGEGGPSYTKYGELLAFIRSLQKQLDDQGGLRTTLTVDTSVNWAEIDSASLLGAVRRALGSGSNPLPPPPPEDDPDGIRNPWDPFDGNLRFHAAGGVVTKAHLGVVGEAGPEAIIPLDRFDWGKSGETHLHFHIGNVLGTPEELAELVRDARNEYDSIGGSLDIQDEFV